MIICLEGVDGTGKSTLAQSLLEEMTKRFPDDEFVYKHATQIKSDVFTEYTDPLKDYIPGSGIHYILDRWHIGEEIYGPLYRGKSAFDKVSLRWTELYLASIGMRTWLLTQENIELQKRLTQRGEDFISLDHVMYIQDEYKKMLKHSPLFAKEITPKKNDSYIVDLIIKDAEYAEKQVLLYKSFGVKYFGRVNTMPRTVLVVENKKINENFDPHLNPDSSLMLEMLADGYWQQFSVVTANSAEKLAEFLNEFLWSTSPIAYGPTVISRLQANNVEFGVIKPPERSDYYTYHVEQVSNTVGAIEPDEVPVNN
jgi:hypothetical protein